MTVVFRPRSRRSESFRAILSTPKSVIRKYEYFRAIGPASIVSPEEYYKISEDRGSARYALALARNEAWAEFAGVEYETLIDTESTDDEGSLRYTIRATLGPEAFASLSGIDDIDGDYGRLVRAELAGEIREDVLANSNNLSVYGPGRYTLAIDEAVDDPELEDEGFGDTDGFGYVAIFEGPFSLADLDGAELEPREIAYLSAIYGAIAITNSDGFVSVEYFDSLAAFEARRTALRLAESTFYGEEGYPDDND